MKFSDGTIKKTWEKGRANSDLDSSEWRQDQCGAWMLRDKYGYANSEYGWEIRSIKPGDFSEENLRPFHYENVVNLNQSRVQCHVTADRKGIFPTTHINQPHNKSV